MLTGVNLKGTRRYHRSVEDIAGHNAEGAGGCVIMSFVSIRILGIESSCDETAAAVVADGRRILSNVVASQVDIHRKYGGVVPELASREHLRAIVPVVREALQGAAMALSDVDAIGVTSGPGLIGALLVGVTYGKALAAALGKPLVSVNHLEGHVRSVFLEAYRTSAEPIAELKLPAVCLIVSGGHTVLYEVTGTEECAPVAEQMLHYRRIGQTRDDAAGEAYDKVARLLALGYPGGPVIDQLAAKAAVGGNGVRFAATKIKGNAFDFSFSGIKTAMLYYLRAHPELEPEMSRRREALACGERKAAHLLPLTGPQTLELLASFQRTVVAELVGRALGAAEETGAQTVLVAGGVAANSELRATFEREGARRGVRVCFPSRELSTDNAAMIAAAAYAKFRTGHFADQTLDATPVMPLA